MKSTSVEQEENIEASETLSDVNAGKVFLKTITFPVSLPGGYVTAEGVLHKELELYPMTGVEEELLSDERLASDGTNVVRVLANCLKRLGDVTFPPASERGIPEDTRALQLVKGLRVSDKTFALIVLRRISLIDGDIMSLNLSCPRKSCAKEFTAKINLAELPIVPFPNPATTAFSFEMPISKIKVEYRHLLVSDEPTLIALIKKKQEAAKSIVLWHYVTKFDGNKPEKWAQLQKLQTADREALRLAIEANEGGIDLTITHECPSCAQAWKAGLPIGINFFAQSSTS